MPVIYENLDPAVRPKFKRFLKWAVIDRATGRRRKSPPTAAVDRLDAPAIETPDTPAIVWLGHASALITLDGVRFITDPVFVDKLGPGVARNVAPHFSLDETPHADVVVISHNHRDHLDRRTIAAIDASHQPRYIVPLGVERYLVQWGVDSARITSLGWWDHTATTGDIEVACVPAQHWSQRNAFDRNKSLWAGFVLRSSAHTVYFAGDSGYFEGFAEIGRRYPDIDLALLPIGAYDPEWFMQPQHMNPEQAGQAMLDVGATRMVSIHWGTYKLTDEPLDEPPSRLDDWRTSTRVAEERVLTLPVGGAVYLPH